MDVILGLVDFNTSHVSINRYVDCNRDKPASISIHLMFLLIVNVNHVKSSYSNFNTSHVSINRLAPEMEENLSSYFNTSHVSINLQRAVVRENGLQRFQYISCFY